MKLDKKDLEILRMLQKNCKISTKEIARKVESPITTVFSKIKRMEDLGIIKEYRAILNPKVIDKGTTCFIFASFSYRLPYSEKIVSQREIASALSRFPEVQEVHVISGNWDLLIKVRGKDTDEIGKFVVDKLRMVKGIEKTMTTVVFETQKETPELIL